MTDDAVLVGAAMSGPWCNDEWPKRNNYLPKSRCRLDPGHEGPHSNGAAAWDDGRRWPICEWTER